MPIPTRLLALGVLVLAPAGLAACGSDDGGSAAPAIEVVSTDDACTPVTSSFAAGKVRFSIKNAGSKATELYVYEGGKVLTEVENVGPGTSRTLSAELKSGKTYELACKPGGKEIKVPITVT